MTSSNLITVTQFAQFAPEVDTSKYDAPTISGLISAASQQVSDYLQFTPLAEDITNELRTAMIDTSGDLVIFPIKVPVISLSSLAITKGSVSIDIQLLNSAGVAKYNIDYTQRSIRYPFGEITLQGVPVFTDFYSLRGNQIYSKISYRGGYEASALPSPIVQATVLITKDLMSTAYNLTGATSLTQGGLSFSFGQGAESRNMMMAKKLLNPYRRIS